MSVMQMSALGHRIYLIMILVAMSRLHGCTTAKDAGGRTTQEIKSRW